MVQIPSAVPIPRRLPSAPDTSSRVTTSQELTHRRRYAPSRQSTFMSLDLKAPRTLTEWQYFAFTVVLLYTLLLLPVMEAVIPAVLYGVFLGVLTFLVVAALVFTVRGFRDLFRSDRG